MSRCSVRTVPARPPCCASLRPRCARRQPWQRRGRVARPRDGRADSGPRHPRSRAGQQVVSSDPGAAPRPLGRHGDAAPRGEVNPFNVAVAVARKDLRSEWRTREMLPALSLFFGTPLGADMVVAVLLATVGMAALGCLFAALVARVRARELLLPLLTLPLWIPFIIAGGQAVQSAMGLPGSYSEAIGLLIDFDILFVVLTSLAARFVLDE